MGGGWAFMSVTRSQKVLFLCKKLMKTTTVCVINVYFFIKSVVNWSENSVVNWSENSVRFECFVGIAF